MPPTAVSFSGCGWLVGFHWGKTTLALLPVQTSSRLHHSAISLGVASVLLERSVIGPSTILAGKLFLSKIHAVVVAVLLYAISRCFGWVVSSGMRGL